MRVRFLVPFDVLTQVLGVLFPVALGNGVVHELPGGVVDGETKDPRVDQFA